MAEEAACGGAHQEIAILSVAPQNLIRATGDAKGRPDGSRCR